MNHNLRRAAARVLPITVLLMVAVSFSCVADAQKTREMEDIDRYKEPENLKQLIENGDIPHVLVDVRTEGEYRRGYIPTAENIPVHVIEQNPPEVSKDTLVVLYCRSGSRSSRAQRILEDLGYKQVINFGGIIDWPYQQEMP
jgi:rhodanese-related sulfurtransferase